MFETVFPDIVLFEAPANAMPHMVMLLALLVRPEILLFDIGQFGEKLPSA